MVKLVLDLIMKEYKTVSVETKHWLTYGQTGVKIWSWMTELKKHYFSKDKTLANMC